MKNPTVSILIPTYNYARYLPEAIESVLAQDFTDFELLIADDASSDNTEEICQRYEAADPRVRFVRHEQNLGMVENWNWCLQQARGRYIKYMLADDKFNQPYALRHLIEALEQSEGISLAVSARALIDEKSEQNGLWDPLGARDRQFAGRELSVECLEKNLNLIGEPTAVLFRRADATRGFDPSFRQLVDLEMWLHLLQSGDLAYLSEPLCCFRRHDGQQTAVNREAGLHLRELIRLGGYMPEGRARRMHFRWMYQMKKSGCPEYQEQIALLRDRFSFLSYTASWLGYKFTRPIYNLRKTIRKRRNRLAFRLLKLSSRWRGGQEDLSARAERTRLVMTLLARDEADVIGHNIEYHLRHGVDFIIATDNASQDGTLEILKKYEAAGRLHLIEEKALDHDQARWVNRMGLLAVEQYHADMIIHCDADEFWTASSGNLKTELLKERHLDCLKVPIWHCALTDRGGSESFPLDMRYLRIPPEGVLSGNWRDFPSSYKVMFRTKHGVPQVDMGNHCLVDPLEKFHTAISSDMKIVHFGIRSRDHFYRKVRNGGSAVASNKSYNPEMCNHWRKWYALYLDGRLDEVYKELVSAENDLSQAVAEGRAMKIEPDDFLVNG